MNRAKRFLSLVLCLMMAFQVGIVAFAADGAYVEIKGIILDKKEMTMVYGSTAKLNAATVPEDASESGLVWKSSNPALLTVDANGNLKAAEDKAEEPSGAQKVTITVTSALDSKISAACVVTVDNEPANKILSALKEIFNLLTAALPTIIEYGSSAIKPFVELLVNFVKDLFATVNVQ